MSTTPPERTGATAFKGSPMTLVGPELALGETAPPVTLTSTELTPVDPLANSQGKARLFITVPSVDTSVCSLESKKFSDAVKAQPSEKAAVYVVSADLPFALKRWSEQEEVENLTLLSDYRGLTLANAWGLHVKEMHLLARAVYVVDPLDRVTYREIVSDISSEPDYDAALAALRAAEQAE